MGPEAVDFLRDYVARHPELRNRVRFNPPRLRRGRAWKRIVAWRLLTAGLELQTAGGRRVKVLPKDGKLRQRAEFAQRLLRLMRSHFPGWKVAQILAGTDRARHQSAALLRVLWWDGRAYVPCLAVHPEEPAGVTDRILSSVLLWWDRLRQGAHWRRNLRHLIILLPEGWSELLLRQFPRLNVPALGYKYDLAAGSLRQIYPRPVESSRLAAPYVIFPLAREVPPLLAQLRERYGVLDLMYRRGRWELSYLGLRLAWSAEAGPECFFDLRKPRVLEPHADKEFAAHLREVIHFRSFPPLAPGHFFYRYRHERWLESLMVRNHRVLNEAFIDVIYPQVPTCIDGERKVLDLLTATRGGRLAVLELKVQRDLDLIFQGLEYWERVEHHLREGDFQRAAYFTGMPFAEQSPLLYLVSPLFEFHRVMPVLRKYLKEEPIVHCVGINSDWQKGIKILRRFEL